MSDRILKCAVYTRKSTEHGLELEFNSLDAQREACEAYIKSQTAEGWKLVNRRYEDGAFSGGNLDRPALQQLLKDIDAGLVDVIVVYKIDRLTRSLADFAKLVEVFDAKKISFVAITQQFNTTTSMGRLTLNVLLSFAQFERELSSERVRDKVAASRKKGKWTGGNVPLGYNSVDKKLVINEIEAKSVRTIFTRYLALRSFQKLVDDLNEKGIVSKRRQSKGGDCGGKPFTYGPLAYVLKNRTYIGETGHKGAWFRGEHPAIVDRNVFEQVQELLKTNSLGRTGRRQQTGALLTGLLFDDRGNRMSPSFSVKRGVRYPFYVSAAILSGRKSEAGSVYRATAADLENTVLLSLHERIGMPINGTLKRPAELIQELVDRIVILSNKITIALKPGVANGVETIEVTRVSTGKSTAVRLDAEAEPPGNQPDPRLIHAVVRAHAWLRLLSDGAFNSVEELAQSVRVHPKLIRKGMRLAFLSPIMTRQLLESKIYSDQVAGCIALSGSLSWNQPGSS